MPDRQHTVYLTDIEVKMLDRALRAYHTVMGIQLNVPNERTEAEGIAHVSSLVQAHVHCDCGITKPPPVKPRVVPIEQRKVIYKGDL